MSHLLAGVAKDMLGGKVLLTVHLQSLLFAELSQQSVVPAQTSYYQRRASSQYHWKCSTAWACPKCCCRQSAAIRMLSTHEWLSAALWAAKRLNVCPAC